jgi:hypothetical protein
MMNYRLENLYKTIYYLFEEYSQDDSLTYYEDFFIKYVEIPLVIFFTILGFVSFYRLCGHAKAMYDLWQSGNRLNRINYENELDGQDIPNILGR